MFDLLRVVVPALLLIWAVYVVCVPSAMLKFLGFLLRHTLIRLRVFGIDNLPASGPMLLVSNHISMLDLLLIQSLSKRPVRFMVDAEVAHYLPTRFIFWYLGVLVVPSARHPREMRQFFVEVRNRLHEGEALCLFPEGGISGNGNLMRFRSGVEPLLPTNVGVTIIPLRIGMLHGRLFHMVNGHLRCRLPNALPVDFSIIFGAPVEPTLSPFQLRQKISELGAEAEKLPQPGERPFHTALLYRAKRRPLRTLFIDAATGKKLNIFMSVVGGILLSRKVRALNRGETEYVGVLLPNGTVAAATLLGVLYADRTPAIVNFSAGQDVAMASVRRAGVKTIFTSRRFLEKLKWEETPEMVFLEEIAPTITPADKLKTVLQVLFTPRPWLARKVAPLSWCNMHNQAVLLFSSGSTGTPKGVMLTHRNINCDIWSFYRLVMLQNNDRVAGNLPLFHAYGFLVEFALPCQCAVPVAYVMNPLSGTDVINSIADYQLTVLTATPTFLQKYLHKATPESLKTLRLVITGAEKLRTELVDKFRELTGELVIEGYGCTELAPIVTINFNNSLFDAGTRSDHPGSIGCPLPGIHVRVVDPETGVELGPGQSGRMQVKAGTVMKGYLKDPDQTARVIQNGYYDTGDIARIDRDGYVYITGRASRFSKVGGEMVPHEAIEDAIAKIRSSELREVAVTGKSDARKGERLVVFYTPDDFDPAAIVAGLKESGLPNVWLPKVDDFVKVPELPILGSGKLDLTRLKRMADEL